ncbi:MAG: M20/M25/M40 family metallo-hydrolase, partial [Deltaproteobacteria bacterium]|nr:M20/M25/M40 family metallo-hydrolase [Deltaproteobacteria bacterium]
MSTLDPQALLDSLIRIRSVSGEEDAIGAAIFELAQEAGLAVERAGRNLVLKLGEGNGKRLLLNSHLDTVPPATGWTTDPFVPALEDGRITGLGANDAKGCVAAMLAAFSRLSGSGFRPDGEIVLALTVEEETGGGAGLEKLLPELEPLSAAVIGEPTDLEICCAQKGLLILKVEAEGLARHAAHVQAIEGPNAVVEAARGILALEGWSPGPDHPLLGPLTCAVTTIEGGSRRNVIPDACTFFLDIRTHPDCSTAEIAAAVEARTGAKVSVFSDRMQPFATDTDEAITRAAH